MQRTIALALVATAGCAGSAGTSRPAPAPATVVASADPAVADDSTGGDATRGAIGAACRSDAGAAPVTTCELAARCLAWTGGYCASACDADRGCSERDTACVPTPRLGAVCARACAGDDDCRVDDGYLCDATWHACLLPNTAAIVPRRCPANTAAHDPAFAPSVALPIAAGATVTRAPALAIVGGAVAAIATGAPTADGGTAGDDPAIAAVGTGSGALTAWLASGDERRYVVVTDARGRVQRGVEADDCAGDASCPSRPRLAVLGKVAYLAYSGNAIGTRVRALAVDTGELGPAITALGGRRGDLAVSGDGRVHVVAMRGGDGGAYGAAQHAIEYAWSRDGGKSFAHAVVVSARDELIPAYFASPVLAVDDRHGWMYVGYVRGGADAVWDLVIAASKDRGATWTRTVIGDGCSLHAVPSLAVDGLTGILHIVTYDTRAEVARVAHLACLPGAQRCVDKGAIDDVPFAAFDTGRLDTRWVGEQTALVVDDKHRSLEAAWAQPVTVDGHVVARVYRATGKL